VFPTIECSCVVYICHTSGLALLSAELLIKKHIRYNRKMNLVPVTWNTAFSITPHDDLPSGRFHPIAEKQPAIQYQLSITERTEHPHYCKCSVWKLTIETLCLGFMYLLFCQGQLVLFLGYSLGGISRKNKSETELVKLSLSLAWTLKMKKNIIKCYGLWV